MQKVLTRQKMGGLALLFHWTMIFCTLGLWTPIYLSARRSRASVTYIDAPIPVAPQPYPQQQPYGQPPAPQQWQPSQPPHQQPGHGWQPPTR